ncbi:acetyl-CoA acetyltransferase [Corynebacterium breve]|uniref:Acetyl-CoA acetyltransferase n=1 Tax=Corynebacterium breve TaxID=3049799 RepID=A0ABY8VF53_9CORY|nr:acetyl-CoA acetyltransferase [Corynebacterium breve]WIM67390.1 acetyl-CoA acetyltransferase [Corynebacterium breve]
MRTTTISPIQQIQSTEHTLHETRDALQERFGTDRRLPKELREESRGMNWNLFTATYCPAPTLDIKFLSSEQHNLYSTRFSAEITATSKTEAPVTFTREILASGPTSAISHMLADEGRHVEILKFHQIELFEATVTIVKISHQVNHLHTAWAVGFGPTSETSIAAALSSAAQRIYG